MHLMGRCAVSDARFRRACHSAVDRLHLYHGKRETLDALARRGTRCAVVTNLPGRIVEPLLERLALVKHFSVVVHAGVVRPRKPSPVPLREAARMMGLGDLRTVFCVGDGRNDALAARRAGMAFAWAAYGYGDGCPDDGAVVLRRFPEVLEL